MVHYVCFQVYLNRQPNPRKKLLVPCILDKPNPKCYVCRENPEVAVKLNPEYITVRTLQDKVQLCFNVVVYEDYRLCSDPVIEILAEMLTQ